jgi:hypothetical protein
MPRRLNRCVLPVLTPDLVVQVRLPGGAAWQAVQALRGKLLNREWGEHPARTLVCVRADLTVPGGLVTFGAELHFRSLIDPARAEYYEVSDFRPWLEG